MKGEKRLHILEYLEKSGLALEELFFIFTVPYGTSFHRAEYLLKNGGKNGTAWKRIKKKNSGLMILFIGFAKTD